MIEFEIRNIDSDGIVELYYPNWACDNWQRSSVLNVFNALITEIEFLRIEVEELKGRK